MGLSTVHSISSNIQCSNVTLTLSAWNSIFLKCLQEMYTETPTFVQGDVDLNTKVTKISNKGYSVIRL